MTTTKGTEVNTTPAQEAAILGTISDFLVALTDRFGSVEAGAAALVAYVAEQAERPCDGCAAEAGEPCAWSCLSNVEA